MFNDVFNDKFISSRLYPGDSVEYWTDDRFREDSNNKEECKMEDKCLFCGGDMTLSYHESVIFTRRAMDQIDMTGGDGVVIASMFDIPFELIKNRFSVRYFSCIDSSMFSIRYKLLYGNYKIVSSEKMKKTFDSYRIGWYKTGAGDILILSDMDKLSDVLDAYAEFDNLYKIHMVHHNVRLDWSPVTHSPMVRVDFSAKHAFDKEPTKFRIEHIFTDWEIKEFFKNKWNPVYKPVNWSFKKEPLKFKLYFGTERATGKRKTICVWEDDVRTIVQTADRIHNGAPVALAFAWCYVKRTFRTVSQFKKHVDKRTYYMDGVLYFEGDCTMDDYAQANLHDNIISMDIYDVAALAITAKRYGGLNKLNEDYIADACDIDKDLREVKSGEFTAIMTKTDEPSILSKIADEFQEHVTEVVKNYLQSEDEADGKLYDDGYLGKVGGTNEKKTE